VLYLWHSFNSQRSLSTHLNNIHTLENSLCGFWKKHSLTVHWRKKFRVWAKNFTAERLKLENSVKNTKCLFYYLKIIWKFQFLKKAPKQAKTLKKQWKKPTFFKIITEGGGTFRLHFRNLQSTESIDLNSVRFGWRCNIGWVTSDRTPCMWLKINASTRTLIQHILLTLINYWHQQPHLIQMVRPPSPHWLGQ
jgi:hypothetical protein